eukprot:scaffold6708_cov134-Cylindrotheca_fusiformis.AAC.15
MRDPRKQRLKSGSFMRQSVLKRKSLDAKQQKSPVDQRFWQCRHLTCTSNKPCEKAIRLGIRTECNLVFKSGVHFPKPKANAFRNNE